MKNIAIFASGGGSCLQAIIDACESGRLPARARLVVSNNSASGALARARRHGIPALHLSEKTAGSARALEAAISLALRENDIDIVFLAGYLKKIGPAVLGAYENRIFNLHPSLLPKYGGKGMHGLAVHGAVIAAGEKVSGATVHRVTDEYDSGEIVAQAQAPVLPGDTAETLAARVLALEHGLAVEALARIVGNEIVFPEN